MSKPLPNLDRYATLLICCTGLAGCHTPQWRVFQSKVPEPLQKPAIRVWAEYILT